MENRLESRKRRQAEGIAAVSQLARRVNASLDLQATLDAVVNTVVELVPCPLAEIDLWDEEQQCLVLQAIRSTPERAFPVGDIFPPGKGYTGWVVRHRQPLLVSDVEARTDIRPHILPGELPFKAYIGLPLMAADELIGVLVLVHDEKGVFDEQDLQLLEALATQAAIAIHNARIYEEVVRRHKELSALYAVSEASNRSLNLNDLLYDALDSVIEVTRADGGGIRVTDSSSSKVLLVAHRGLSKKYVQQAEEFPIDQEIVGWVARMGEACLSQDMWVDDRVSPHIRELLKEVGHRSLAQVPLVAKNEVLGTLGVVSKREGFFTQDDLKLLTAIGQQLGVAIENEKLRQDRLREERLAAIGRVATGVAHDLRSPLGGILRGAEFLSRDEISPETREKLGRSIVALTRRLIATSQQILDYILGEKVNMNLALCPLNDFLDEVLEVMQVDLSDQGIEVIRDYQYAGEILMDADRMAQVVFNLVSNARDAMPRGGTLTLSTRESSGKVEITFMDSGPGVPEELSEQIFDPFYSYGKSKGAGLGLAISRQIVQEHGGAIRLECTQGQGAAFVISLPV